MLVRDLWKTSPKSQGASVHTKKKWSLEATSKFKVLIIFKYPNRIPLSWSCLTTAIEIEKKNKEVEFMNIFSKVY